MGRREKPLEPSAGPVQRLAHGLRKLRVDAGGPTYRVMAQRVPYSAPTLSAAAAGERLPTLPVLLAYVAACEGDPAEWERHWYETVAEDAGRGTDEGESPYPGLARFGTGEAERFFGRDDLVDELVGLTARRRVAAVIGASGSGKSSLLRAGLIPALRRSTGPARPAAIRILTPGERPARTHRHLFTPADGDGDTLLVVDQFEEVFSLCHDPAERDAFLRGLLAARDAAARLRVILAVRADFYGRCAEHGPLADALGDANLLVGPMPPSRLREAIVRPAAAERLVVERALTARIVADVVDEPGGLPLMAHALREVWRRRGGRTLTEAAYEAIGGVRGAVAHTAEDVYGRLGTAAASKARTLLLRLVAPGDGTQDTRCPVDRTELPPGCDDVLERLVAARLLTVDGTSVDLAHEALIGAWPRLRAWIEEDRERLRLHRALTEAARSWAELDRDPGALYRGERLRAAREAFEGSKGEDQLTVRETEFLRAGIAAQEQGVRARTRAARRTRVLLAALAVVLCLATVAGAVAWQQNRNGHRQSAEAQARRIAGVAETLRTSDPVTSMRLSVAAWRLADLPETREAVRSAAAQRERDAFFGDGGAAPPATTRFLSADGRTLTSATGRRVTRRELNGGRRISTYDRPGSFDSSGYDADVSADGRLIARATRRGFQIWDLRSERVVGRPLAGGEDENMGTAGRFAPSGRMFIVQHEARGDVEVWDVRGHKVVTRVRGADAGSAPFSVMSPDDRLLAVCSGDKGPLAVREVGTGRDLPRTWPRALDRAFCEAQEAVFTPDGRALVVPVEGGVRTWDVRTGDERPRLKLPGAYEPDVDLSADGTLAVALGSREVVLWRTADPGTPLLRHPVSELTADGVRLDEAAGVVRVQVSTRVVRTLDVRDALSGPRGTRSPDIEKARFSPNGRTLLTLERRGKEGVFRLRDGRDGAALRTLPGRMCADCGDPALAFSPDSGTLAYGVDQPKGTTIRRWDLRHGKEEAPPADVASRVDGVVLPGGGGPPVTVGSPPTGMQELDDWKADVWRLGGQSEGLAATRLLHSRRPGTGALLLAPDGRELLSLDGRMTDVGTGRTRPVLRGEDTLWSGTFSPDGRFLAVADDNGRLTLWDGRATRVLAVLTEDGPTQDGPTRGGPARFLAFSADGSYLAASDADGSVRVWETDTPRLVGARYAGTGGPVLALGFTGDALRVMTSRGAIRTVSVAAGRAADSVCERARGGLSREEWRTYLPDSPYRQTC
ncbi:WD40 repeat domain-containing protein [Streptomyces sp. NPDC046465]|uniref:WD40 repeat domain-containing protein n=1 Tax=Streptomyces sp. NPDC046465 TaxID=3155810 RepID=UPI0033DCE8AF